MKSQVGQKILKATESIIANVSDLLLFEMFFSLHLVGTKSVFDIYRAADDAHLLVEKVNHNTIKNALYTLTKRGYVKRSAKHSALEIEITESGKKRIQDIIPQYHKNRPWDGYVYLISYDIPTKANKSRNLLRLNLKRIGCALLQESLWITPYNPTQIIDEYIGENHIPGTILVSKMGKDGAIGQESLPDLIYRVYQLTNLNKQYVQFISWYEANKNKIPRLTAKLKYLSILKHDPQLPFGLEPNNLKAKEAYRIYLQSASGQSYLK